ncbi:MAG: ATP-binding protein [Oscillospiraceae bacterium]
MSYDAAVLRRATARLEEQRRLRERALEDRRAEVELRVPRVAEIDARLRRTLLEVARATFQGGDPTDSINALRDENLALQAERERLLAAAGYPPDVLEDKPACPKCRDKGWVGSQMCDCLKVLCAQEQIRELSKLLDLGEQSFQTFRLDVYSAEPDPRMGKSPRENMSLVLDICRNYANKFGKYYFDNLYLYGAPGLGKTFLSACIARVVSENGFSVVYDTAGNVFTAFESQKFSKDEEDARDAREEINRYLNCDLLILDDLGSEMTTALVQATLYTLLNTRLTAGRRTVISSNLTPDQVRSRYTPQIASRLEGEFRALPFFGSDIRLSRNQ